MSTFVYMTRCDGCGHCVDICPSDIMHIDENIRRAKNIEPNFCWECYSCVKACPNHAIDVRGYADFAPMGHSVRVRREEEKGTISRNCSFFFFSSNSYAMTHWCKVSITSNIYCVIWTSFNTGITLPTKIWFNILCTSYIFINVHNIWRAYIHTMTTAITSCHVYKSWHNFYFSPFFINILIVFWLFSFYT